MTFAELWYNTSERNGDTSAGTTKLFSASFYGGSGNITAYTPVVGTWTGVDQINPTHQQIIRDRWSVAQAGIGGSLRIMQTSVAPVSGTTYRVVALLDITPVITSGVYLQVPLFVRNAGVIAAVTINSQNSASDISITGGTGVVYTGAVTGPTLLVDSRVTLTATTVALTVLVNSVQVYSGTTTYSGAFPTTLETYQWASSAVGASMPGMYSLVIE